MKVDTTINIAADLLDLLDGAALITGKSRSLLASLLMVRLAQCHEQHAMPWKRVRYQERGNRARYRRVHLYLEDQEYELFIDLRKFCKQSVSRLIAQAINLYIDEVINNVRINVNNYPSINYVMDKVIKDGSTCWVLSWGISPEPSKQKYCIT